MQEPAPVNSSKNSVLKSALAMSLGTLASRILGLGRDMVLAAYFSLTIKDAFVVAFRLPNLFRRLLGEGSLAASFVPLFVEYTARESTRTSAKDLANAVYTLLIIITGLLTGLGIIYMEPLIQVLVGGEGYQSIVGKIDVTVQMARIMFGFVFLVTLYAFLMSLLNIQKKFFLPAVAPALFNLVFIICALLPPFQFVGDQLAIGVLLGGVVQLLTVVAPLVRLREMPRLTLHFGAKGVSAFFKNLLPSLLGMSVVQIMTLFNTYFASELPEGSHSYIYFADRLLEFPLSLLSVSLGVALLPTLSEHWARGEVEKMQSVARKNIQLLLFLSLPCMVGFYLLAEPIVSVVYGRGRFTNSDVIATAEVLKVYSLLLIFSGLHRVTVPNFYAIKNTWLPALASVSSLVVHLLVANWAVERFGLLGLVGSTTFAAFLNLSFLLVGYKYYFGSLHGLAVLKSVLHLTPSLAVMGAFCFYVRPQLHLVLGYEAFALAATLVASILIFFVTNHFVRHPDADDILAIFKRKLFKKNKPA